MPFREPCPFPNPTKISKITISYRSLTCASQRDDPNFGSFASMPLHLDSLIIPDYI